MLNSRSVLRTQRTAATFNLQVGDFESYFVGEAGIWVHNCPSKLVVEALSRERLARVLPGRTLRDSPYHAADYIDDLGRTYDQMGNPGMIARWEEQRANFLSQIERHLDYKGDFTVIDLTDFPKHIKDEVGAFILSLPESKFDRIIPIGF